MTARYDRLAPLIAPAREQAFPGWSALHDLNGAERDSDAARRARLRFLTLRPVLRLAQWGLERIPVDSFERQIDRVREELGQLPARDAERAVLARLLNDLRTRQLDLVVHAVLTVAEFAEANGQFAAAAEYARTAADLARSARRDNLAAAAARSLSRVNQAAGHLAEAASLAQQASELALRSEDRGEWIRAVGQLAATQRSIGDGQQAEQGLRHALQRAREWGNDSLVGLALAQLCRHAAETEDWEGVIEHGSAAFRSSERAEDRAAILKLMGDALVALGLPRAAERCYSLISLRAPSPPLRAAGLAGAALLAAQSGDRDGFRERRSAALRELPPAHRAARASTHLELGRGAALAGDSTAAREHVQEALALVRLTGPSALRLRAEQAQQALERNDFHSARAEVSTASEQTRRIAADLEQWADSVITE